MKLNLNKRKLTVVVIPDTHRSTFQLNISHLVLVMIPAFLLLLIGSILLLQFLNQHTKHENNELKLHVASLEQTLSGTLTMKDAEIESLNAHILTLSEQADEVQNKMEDLIELENELIALTQSDPDLFHFNQREVQIAGAMADEHSGGPEVEVSTEEMEAFARQTEFRYYLLNNQMSSLTQDLTLAVDLTADYQAMMRVTPSIWPTSSKKVTSNFGYRKDPFTYRTSMHTGIDLAGKYGSDIFATADGKVLSSEYNRSKGHYIIIEHGYGVRTVYMHLSKRTVKAGDEVSKGDIIGQLGSTGRSTGPHLHYEVFKNGKAVDPAPFMN